MHHAGLPLRQTQDRRITGLFTNPSNHNRRLSVKMGHRGNKIAGRINRRLERCPAPKHARYAVAITVHAKRLGVRVAERSVDTAFEGSYLIGSRTPLESAVATPLGVLPHALQDASRDS
jgi:hypothetical protein